MSVLAACSAVGFLMLVPSAAHAAVCADYTTQAEAQRAADTRDADGDGIYCEALPCPCSSSSSPAPAPSTPVQPVSSRTGSAVASLRAELRRLRASRSLWKRRAQMWQFQRDDRDDRLGDAAETIVNLTRERDGARAQLQLAQAGTAGAVQAAAATGDPAVLLNIILGPARAGWPCKGGTMFTGTTFYSADFNLPGYCL